MTLTASQCDNSVPPSSAARTLNQGQGQLHRWTESNPVKLGFNQNCRSSGHAKASCRDSFHKHLSHSGNSVAQHSSVISTNTAALKHSWRWLMSCGAWTQVEFANTQHAAHRNVSYTESQQGRRQVYALNFTLNKSFYPQNCIHICRFDLCAAYLIWFPFMKIYTGNQF